MLALAAETTVLAPARAQPEVPGRPQLRAVVRHLAMNLFIAPVVPTALFYVCLVTANLWTALIAALMWCYVTVAYRLTTGQPTSVLLWEGLLATRRRLVVAA